MNNDPNSYGINLAFTILEILRETPGQEFTISQLFKKICTQNELNDFDEFQRRAFKVRITQKCKILADGGRINMSKHQTEIKTNFYKVKI